jgi:DNA-binding NtrC family response regulator
VYSPLALAHGGVLVLLDAAALPIDVQRFVARALAEKRAPWERAEPLDIVLAVTAVEAPGRGATALTPDAIAAPALDSALAARLGDAFEHAVALPPLAERPEDVRAVLTDRLAREGLRRMGSPVGIDDAAYARLVEYSFPGDDVELAAIVQRLIERIAADPERRLVTADDIEWAFGAARTPERSEGSGAGRGRRTPERSEGSGAGQATLPAGPDTAPVSVHRSRPA